jgi:alginate O-acetyltransferase complex protein AlgI
VLFNSYEFIFVFLPATLAIFFLLGKASRNIALSWLIVASLLFYAWWRPSNILIILTSLATNYLVARTLLSIVANNDKVRAGQIVLGIGIAFNVAFLGYFKYANFLQAAINDLAGTDFVLTRVILPLGISFFTFQQIAFLIDIHGRNIKSFALRDFCLFVLFFPQLIAGPIVHFREMMPQFLSTSRRLSPDGFSVGLTLFSFGLFKKVVLADGIAPYVSPIYEAAATTGEVSLFPAWIAAIGFTLQIYFDFSGYSDMAAGLARCFGVRLPPNFDSPLKASNIIDFWSRWHVTLTRFLTAYLYNPLALWQTRKRLAKGLPGLGGPNSGAGAFLRVLAIPTILTMFLSGLWHGAGYLFIFWGLLHGFYLTINHAWRLVGPQLWSSRDRYEEFMQPIGFVITFTAVAVTMILFRSPNADAAVDLLKGIAGLNGIGVPRELLEPRALFDAWLSVEPLTRTQIFAVEFVQATAWTLLLLLIALFLPNSLQILARYEPVLGAERLEPMDPWCTPLLAWNPTIPWAIATSILAAAAIVLLGGDSEFLYWQF